jgi:hypothetical protein
MKSLFTFKLKGSYNTANHIHWMIRLGAQVGQLKSFTDELGLFLKVNVGLLKPCIRPTSHHPLFS